jgi:hypothetical protein
LVNCKRLIGGGPFSAIVRPAVNDEKFARSSEKHLADGRNAGTAGI